MPDQNSPTALANVETADIETAGGGRDWQRPSTATSAADPVVAAEIATEQAHVDRVYTELESAARRARTVAADGHRRAGIDPTDFYRPDDQATGLFERDALVHNAAVRLAALESAHEGLVFGRLDLDDEHEPRYIGRLGVRDDDFNALVVDWRAPAAGAFYRATPVQRHGVIRRRVLRSRGERVVGVEDDLMVAAPPQGMVVVGDGALMAAITRSRDAHMHDIVATIQADQDEAIRAPWRGVTEITGGPGTGKTVVALHRAAYLLYSERRRFEAGGVLVVGPSAAFSAYIERVLPSLGEEAVAVRSIGQVVDGMNATRHDEPAAAAVKGSLRVRKVLARAAADAVPQAPDRLRVYVAGRMVDLDADALDGLRRRLLRNQQRNRAAATARQELGQLAWRRLRRTDADPDEEQKFLAAFDANEQVDEFVHEWWPTLDAREVLVWLADAGRLARYADGVLTDAQVAELHRSYAEHNDFSVEDVALLDDLSARLGTPAARDEDDEDEPAPERTDESVVFADPAARVHEVTTWQDRTAIRDAGFAMRPIGIDNTYAHIVVDEAQDLSPMQWRMLGRRGRHSSWTVVGDAAQSSWPDPAEAAAARDEAFARLQHRSFTLTRNYRNAAEIFELAADLIVRSVPDADVPEAVRTTGVAPRLVDVAAGDVPTAAAEQVARLLQDVTGSVAVVVPASLRPAVTDALSRAGLAGDARLVVTDPLTTKGLEYDGVVLVEPDAVSAESPGGVKTLYVALTRAAHRLTTVGSTACWRTG